MKIKELKQEYYDSSSTVSSLVRQLALAGVGVVWIVQLSPTTSTPPGGVTFACSLYLFVIALSLDLLQYVYKTALWGGLQRYHWRKHESDKKDVYVPGWVNYPTHLLFVGKIMAVGIAYIRMLTMLPDLF